MINISKFTDSEFLSFLYAERDRELSNKAYPGWSNWALVGTIIAIIFYGYELLGEHRAEINYSYAILDLNIFSALLLSATPTIWYIISCFKRKRMVDSNRVRSLSEVFPIIFFIIATLLAVGIVILDFYANISPIIIYLWGGYILVLLAICIYTIIFRNKLVIDWRHFNAFSSDVLEFCYIIVVTVLLTIIDFFAIRGMGKLDFFSIELKLAICSLSLVVVIYMLLQINLKKTDITTRIDLLIDVYLHTNESKENIYKNLEILRFGQNSAQALELEIQNIKKSIKQFKEGIPTLNKYYEDLMNTKITAFQELRTVPDEITITLQQGQNLLDQMEKLLSKCQEILNLKICIIDIEQVQNTLNEAKEELQAGLLEVENLQKMAFEYVEQYACYSEGRLCCMQDCSRRYNKNSLINKIKSLFRNKKCKK